MHHRPGSSLPLQAPWRRLWMVAGLALAALCAAEPALAQFRLGDAPATAPRIPGTRNLSTMLKLEGSQTTADYILAVVNSELITHTDVDKRVARILDTAPRGSNLPPPETLRQQVLDALIDEKIQMQHARSIGMNIGDAEVDDAVANIAAQNQISLDELRSRMKADGLDYERYRNSLREQMLLERIRSREVNARIQISDADIDAFNAQAAAAGRDVDVHLAHILIAVPEGASASQVKELSDKAEGLRQRVISGANFAQLAKEFSSDPGTKDMGGSFGMRPASRLPELFTDAVKNLKVGEVAKLIRSGAGFHVVKLIERENAAKASYTQQRARHILLRTSPQTSIAAARDKIAGIRKEIVGGQSSFAQMARQHSEDGSATKGGDLGWSAPGQFVPEFEKALLALQPGQISEPVVSRFGVHLIQLVERREVELTEQQKREAARSVLREQRFESTYEDWARELRGAAFVEMRDAP
ncbi:MAG TPA: peptidylprolyl isomerase [Aquabacterium sp.]|uniref:peptidylprolyl isomerase n=1 Tax=Aquabacterium sp. TaxID=1872578 RepID=UPI002E30E05C|nr:peptidylprolyl isomerase [Aquabacterium sp.]HEX5373046.1 peptidylprolyl isomerase [Aquabacterium sp.]